MKGGKEFLAAFSACRKGIQLGQEEEEIRERKEEMNVKAGKVEEFTAPKSKLFKIHGSKIKPPAAGVGEASKENFVKLTAAMLSVFSLTNGPNML